MAQPCLFLQFMPLLGSMFICAKCAKQISPFTLRRELREPAFSWVAICLSYQIPNLRLGGVISQRLENLIGMGVVWTDLDHFEGCTAGLNNLPGPLR